MAKLKASAIWEAMLTEKEVEDIDETIKHRWISRANRALYRALFSYFPNKFINDEPITVVSGTTQYALPSDFGWLTPPHAGLFRLNSVNNIVDSLYETSWGDPSNGLWYDDTNFYLTGKVYAGEWHLRYLPRIETITDDDDDLIIDTEDRMYDEEVEVMLRMLMWLYDMREEEEDDLIIRNQQLQQFAEDELKKFVNPERKKLRIPVSRIHNDQSWRKRLRPSNFL